MADSFNVLYYDSKPISFVTVTRLLMIEKFINGIGNFTPILRDITEIELAANQKTR